MIFNFLYHIPFELKGKQGNHCRIEACEVVFKDLLKMQISNLKIKTISYQVKEFIDQI